MLLLRRHFARIEASVFIPAVVFIGVVIACLTIYPLEASRYINQMHHYLTWEMGGFFLVMTFLVIISCAWLACSRYGTILLGAPGDKPDFSFLTWLGLIFTSGTGGSLLYLASVEWIWIIQQPPFGAEPGSVQAARWASAYGMFHWGPSAWAWYLICAVPIGWFMHVKKTTSLKISDLCRGWLGNRVDGVCGHLLNFFYMFGLLGGAVTSLALGTPMISAVFCHVFGLDPDGQLMNVVVIFIWTLVPLLILFFGLKNGVARASNWNIRADIVMLLAILVCGPTAFILNQSIDGLGLMLQNFITMSLSTDAIGKGGFPQAWTVFYFSWWVVYAIPFGLFIARISKGRTIRQLIVCGTLAGSLGCMVFYMVLANFGLYLQTSQVMDFIPVMNEQGRGVVVSRLLEQLPWSPLFLFAFGAIALISYITGHCTVGYALGFATQKQADCRREPEFWNVAFWLILTGIVATTLYLLDAQSLQPLQTVSILTGLPLCGVVFILLKSFLTQHARDNNR
ncbi:BCCT family transporter [[Enterobacter] lignolyticus]|uniref:BCCT transporter n=1 Tax=Enterobacter lignolyticus (strain SCF1) TaxID=701347 RepID=E3G878_ENTLS|nr:BCCT family transporter [[Enterobacter] lignolyticus]ADO49746.1 BCCT transporter [[Enterobacter] lignolyticus SCF1]